MLDKWRDQVNADSWLVHRGRYLSTTFMLDLGDQQHLVRILDGRVDSVANGPFVMPRWQFALRTSREAWAKYCQPLPPPGFHDLMALIRYKTLRLEGDQHPFMANLLYFKDLLSHMRSAA
jgi:hypothetical protein